MSRIESGSAQELRQFRPVAITFGLHSLDFHLPKELEAGEPPEARGLRRDEVRLMVSHLSSGIIEHARFRDLPRFLHPGDLLLLNTSGTMNAALNARRENGESLELHLSTRLPGSMYVVELRQPAKQGSSPLYSAHFGERINLPGGAWAVLLGPYQSGQYKTPVRRNGKVRLWLASLHVPFELPEYLERFGFPIRYKYVKDAWPNEYYQNVYSTERGSAEMPSAGRAFTHELLAELRRKGVQIATLLLHTGVASLEEHEPPYEEYYRVPEETAQAVNKTRSSGKRVIAVGTTSVRAIESVTDENGVAQAGEGWTELVITPERGLRAVDGLLTGLHEPKSTHLAMLEALASEGQIVNAYREALQEGYLWHEFGDLHLILP